MQRKPRTTPRGGKRSVVRVPGVVERRGVAEFDAHGAKDGLEVAGGNEALVDVVWVAERDGTHEGTVRWLVRAGQRSERVLKAALSRDREANDPLTAIARTWLARDEAELLERAKHAAHDGGGNAKDAAKLALELGAPATDGVEHVESGRGEAEAVERLAGDADDTVVGALEGEELGVHRRGRETPRQHAACPQQERWCDGKQK